MTNQNNMVHIGNAIIDYDGFVTVVGKSDTENNALPVFMLESDYNKQVEKNTRILEVQKNINQLELEIALLKLKLRELIKGNQQ